MSLACLALLATLAIPPPAIAADKCDGITPQTVIETYQASHWTMRGAHIVIDGATVYPDFPGCVALAQLGADGQRLGWVQHFLVTRQGGKLKLEPFLVGLRPNQMVWRY